MKTTTLKPTAGEAARAARAEAETRQLAYAREVNDLCALAGLPLETATAFIARNVHLEDVRRAALEAKAARTDAGEINAHNPGKKAAPADHGWSQIAQTSGRPQRSSYSPAGVTSNAA